MKLIIISVLLFFSNPVLVWLPFETPTVTIYDIKVYNEQWVWVAWSRPLEPWITEQELMFQVQHPGKYYIVIKSLENGEPNGAVNLTNEYYFRYEEILKRPSPPTGLTIN